jgi:site-specific DNA recombinase
MKQPKPAAQTRVAIYARFSNDIQKCTSIDRQFADLEKAAERFGFKLDKRHYFCDRAQTATTLFDRPGLTRELLGASAKNEFDVVLVEQTDRLARSRADLFWLADRFKFDNVKIFTPVGEVGDLQLTFDGHQNADFITKLAIRVKSGHDEIARHGLIPGRAAYGYDCVTHYLPGEEAGVKKINADQARIVIRIFKEYVSGKSPRRIAADLMRDNIPSPSGTAHRNFQSIVGGMGKKRGIIHNQLYIGVYLKNRFFNIKNPRAENRVTARKADPDDLITAQVPHLKIIDQKLWDAAHKLRNERGNKKFGASGQVQRAVVPRNQHLLAGLLRCAECNGGMIVTASDRNGLKRVACSAAHNRQSCQHAKTYNLDKLTALAIDSMCVHLTDPEFIKEKARAKSLEFARLEKENSGARQAAIKQYDRLDIQIKKMVRALDDEEGDIPKEIMASLRAKEIERRGLEERIRLLNAESSVTTLHPRTLQAFGKNIETLHAKLKRNPDDPACRMALSNILDCVLVHKTTYNAPYEVSLYARLSAVLGVDLFSAPRPIKETVAAEGLKRTAAGGVDTSSTSSGSAPALVAMQ